MRGRLTDRGGALGAMETGYQRGRIQDESLLYEQRKHDGTLPIVGVNTFRPPAGQEERHEIELMRATEAEKQSQLDRLADFHARHAEEAPAARRCRSRWTRCWAVRAPPGRSVMSAACRR